MEIEITSPFGACGVFLLFLSLPLIIIWRVRSTYKEMQQGEPKWRNSASYKFITNPENLLTVRIIASLMLFFVFILLIGFIGLVVYIGSISGSRGWIVILAFLIPLFAGMVFAPIALFFGMKLRKKVRKDYLARDHK